MMRLLGKPLCGPTVENGTRAGRLLFLFPGLLRSILTRFRRFPVPGNVADRMLRKNPTPASLRSTALQGTVMTEVSVQRKNGREPGGPRLPGRLRADTVI
jgi:hypothetical protein